MTGYALPNPKNPGRQDAPATSSGPIGVRQAQMMMAVMLATLLYVAYVTQWSSKASVESTRALVTQQLVIKDAPNGDILIELLSTPSHPIPAGEPSLRFSGEQGFLRGTLRALARERKVRHLSPLSPFELALHEDGRLSITDTLTHQGIDLEAFGPDNLAVFVQILQASAPQAFPSASLTPIPKENQ